MDKLPFHRKPSITGVEIASAPLSFVDMAFAHAVLCQVELPRSKVDGREFMRRSGADWVCVQAGYLDEGSGPVLQPVPYGAMPRLALAWISTYAVRHNTREIRIGGSAAEFLRLMDSAVPLDNRALLALKGSALALDVYAWLAHRLHRIEGRGAVLHWKALREQFAQEYDGKDADEDFKKEFLHALAEVLAVYPLLLNGSPPPVLDRSA